MGVYIFLFLLIILGQVAVRGKMISNKFYCSVVAITMILICGLRDTSLGLSDTEGVYHKIYDAAAGTKNLKELIELYLRVNFGDKFVPNSSGYSLGFLIISWALSLVYNNYNFFLLCLSIFYFWVCVRFIYKHSTNACISFLVFAALNGMTSAFYLVRHTIVMALLIVAFEMIISKKRILALVFVGIATLTHISALVFVVIFIVPRIQLNRNRILFLLSATLVGGLSVKPVFELFVNVVGGVFSYYMHYLNHNTGKFAQLWFVGAAVVILATLCYKKLLSQNENNRLFVTMTLLYCGMLACQVVIDEFNRLALFFVLAPAVLLPNTIATLKAKNRFVLSVVVVCGFTGYWFLVLQRYNAVPYKTFWM